MTDQVMRGYVEALEETLRSTLTLAEGFDDADWARPTRCPGWDVHDQVAHLVGVEAQLLGEPLPPEAPAGAHVRDAAGAYMERAVHARRGVPGADLLAEFRTVLGRRLDQLRSRPLDAEEEVLGVLGKPLPAGRMLAVRVFDCWAHEQDIRAAVSRPGNLDGAAAQVSRRQIESALPYLVARGAGVPAGRSVALEVTGALPWAAAVAVGDDGRGQQVAPATLPGGATVTLRLDWADLVARVCGRAGAETTPVDVAGDEQLAGRVLAGLAMTP